MRLAASPGAAGPTLKTGGGFREEQTIFAYCYDKQFSLLLLFLYIAVVLSFQKKCVCVFVLNSQSYLTRGAVAARGVRVYLPELWNKSL